METMQGTYQPSLVLLSLFIAAFASYAAFHAAGRLKASTRKKRTLWAVSGGFCLGGGIWSMHFIGMLAYDMGMTVTYDPALFALSIGCAVTDLELEITESIVQEPEQAVPVMREIREIGVKISLDDFGTGYSSLSYLKDFPLNTLKIDKSFVDNMEHGYREKAIVDAIINMAHRLEFNVIAEGIENETQLQLLSGEACEEYQGYYYSPPLPSSDIKK